MTRSLLCFALAALSSCAFAGTAAPPISASAAIERDLFAPATKSTQPPLALIHDLGCLSNGLCKGMTPLPPMSYPWRYVNGRRIYMPRPSTP